MGEGILVARKMWAFCAWKHDISLDGFEAVDQDACGRGWKRRSLVRKRVWRRAMQKAIIKVDKKAFRTCWTPAPGWYCNAAALSSRRLVQGAASD